MFTWLKKTVSPSREAPSARVGAAVANAHSRQIDDSATCKNSGDQYFEEGKLKEAAEFYRKALAINPNYAEAYNNLGNVLCEQALFDEAEQSLKQAILLKPELFNPYCNLGSLQLKRGKPKEAIENLSKALELNTSVESIYRDLCYALFQTGQYETAKRIITQGLSVNPEFADFHSSPVAFEGPGDGQERRMSFQSSPSVKRLALVRGR